MKNLMKVFPIPLFKDNYCYLMRPSTRADLAFLVDPAVSDDVYNYLQKNHPNISISHFLITHKHWDHAGDFPKLLSKLEEQQNSKIEVIMGELDANSKATTLINSQQSFNFGSLNLTATHAPCHTKGHVLFYFQEEEDRIIFTGDTLFLGGIGRFFEGTAKEMIKNLDYLKSLPPDTKMFCGHEYATITLGWGCQIEPENQVMMKKFQWAKDQRQKGEPTIPSTLGEEMKTNIFMRIYDETLRGKVGAVDPEDCLRILRKMKDERKVLYNLGFEF